MSTNNDNETAPPAPRGPSIAVSPVSPPASSSPPTTVPAGSPPMSQSAVHTSSSAVSQAEAFLATVTTPQQVASPTNTATVHINVATTATLTQSSTVSTNGTSPSHGPTVPSPSKPLYNGIPLSSQTVAALAQKYDDLMTDLSILRGEFDKDKPIDPLHIAFKAEIENRGFGQMRDHFDLAENINDLEREVKARETAQKAHSMTDEMANNMLEEINKYNDFDQQFKEKLHAITDLRLALEHMGTRPGEPHYAYGLYSPFTIIGNQTSLVGAQRARRKSSKMATPKQGTPRQETPMYLDDTPMVETPAGQISPNKRKSAAVSTPATGLGELDDDSQRRSGRVAKRAKAGDLQHMNGSSSGKGKAPTKGSMTGPVHFPNLSRNPKTTNANGNFTPANGYTSAHSPYAAAPYAAPYPAPTPQTKEGWMLEQSAEVENILNQIQIHKNDLANLQLQESSRVRELANLDTDIQERRATIKVLEKTIHTKQDRLDGQEKLIRSSESRMSKVKGELTSAMASMQAKFQQEDDVDKRLAEKMREEKAVEARILELKEQKNTLEQEVRNLEQEKASKK